MLFNRVPAFINILIQPPRPPYSQLPPFFVGNMLKSAVTQPLSTNSVLPAAYIWRPAVPGPSIFSRPVFPQRIFSLAPHITTHPVPRLLPKSNSDVTKDKLKKMITDTENGIKGVMTLLQRHGIELLLPGIPR